VKKISNLALYADIGRDEAIAAAHSIAGLAMEAHAKLQVDADQASKLSLNGALVSKKFPESADVLVSLGGDGTLLEAAHRAYPFGVPILGVDFGRTGFLTEVGRGEYQRLIQDLLRNGMETVDRTALEATIIGRPERYFALNDIHIDRSHRGHILMFGIEIGSEKVADIPADGVVVSSPTGSTAYFLSAGGPIIAPGLDAIGIAPICPHTLFSRPLVVDASERIRISVPPDSGNANLYVDGRQIADMQPGSAVEIVKAKRPAQFVRLDNRHFFKMLERKLHWGTSIKERRREY
jgi:NAD+ kinase